MNRVINSALALLVMMVACVGMIVPVQADIVNELLGNTGFEGAWYWHDASWSVVSMATEAAHSGSSGLMLSGSTQFIGSWFVPVDNAKPYQLGVWAKVVEEPTGGNPYFVQIDEFTTNQVYIGSTAIGMDFTKGDGGWRYYSRAFYLDPGTTEVVIWFKSDFGGVAYFDDAAMALLHQVYGHVNFEDFTGKPTINHDISSVGVQVQFLQNGGVAYTKNTFLNIYGDYAIDDVPDGVYDIAFKTASSLRKIVPAVEVVTNHGKQCDVTLTNGDLDGDNEITSSDLSIAIKNIDKVGD